MTTTTLSALRSNIQNRLGDVQGTMVTPTEIDAAINRAIVASYPSWYTQGSSTFSGSASTFEYTFPSAATHVTRLFVQAEEDDWWPVTEWYVGPGSNSTTSKVIFEGGDFAGETLKAEYIAACSTLSGDTSSTTVHPEFVEAFSIYELLWVVAQRDPDWRDLYLRERDRQRDLAELARKRYGMHMPTLSVHQRRRPG